MSVRCRLVRPDGSKWHIKELRDVGDGFRVRAVPNGDAPSVARSDANGRPPSLEDEPLRRGDRVEWIGPEEEVLWSMKIPVGAESSRAPGDALAG